MSTPPNGDFRPVSIAGYGLCSAAGGSIDAALRRLRAGDPPLPVARPLVAGEVTGDSAGEITGEIKESAPHFSLAGGPVSESWLGRARQTILGVMAESGALADRTVPLFIASSSIDVGAYEAGEATGADCLAFSEQVARWLDWTGPVFWLSTACTSAINALRSAQRMIETEAVESAVVLGIELDNRFSAAGFAAMQLLSPDTPKPLAANRNGLVLGDAVAVIRLCAGPAEPNDIADIADIAGSTDMAGRAGIAGINGTTATEVAAPADHPPARPDGIVITCKKTAATPLRWRLRGGANVVDGRDPAGAALTAVAAMAGEALASAGLVADEIDLIKLQASGSPHNDGVEIDGLRQVFAPLPALCSLKPLLGHTLGAAGVAELALLLGCLEAGVWPPQYRAGLDPALDPAIGTTLAEQPPMRLRYLLAIILGFGGGHAAVVIEDTLAARR